MPTALTWCDRCAATVYDEDDVPGACACPDGQLRGLLAMRQREAARPPIIPPPPVPTWPATPLPPPVTPRVAARAPVVAAPVSQELPALSPELLMSGAALAEYRAMQSGAVTVPTMTRGRRAGEGPLDISLDDDGGEPTPTSGPLEDLWMGSSEMEAIASSGVQTDFTDIEMEPPRYPSREAARFRVDRPPPAPSTPTGPRVSNPRERNRPTPRSIQEIRAQARQAGAAPLPTPQTASPRVVPLPSRPEPTPMSVYERLASGRGPLDD